MKFTRDIARGQLTFDAGWMWYDYLSVIVENTNGNGDVSFQGLYFGLKWHGNIA